MHTKHKHYHHHHHQPNSKYPNKPKPATAYNEQSQYPNRHKPPATAHSDHSQYPEITKPVMEYHAGKREHKSPKTAAENRAFESDDNFIVRDKRYPLPHKIQRSDEEYTITYVPFKVERNQKVHETTPEVVIFLCFKNNVPICHHANKPT